MPMGSGKVSTHRFWRSNQLLQNKFFDLSTPSMRKGRDGGEKKMGEKKKKKKRLMKMVATTSLPLYNVDVASITEK